MNPRLTNMATFSSSSAIRVFALTSPILCGCKPDSAPTNLPATISSPPFVSERLDELNRIGAQPLDGRTYQFNLDSKCTILVSNQVSGRIQVTQRIALEQLTTKVIPYATGDSFGLKGYLAGQAGSLDLLDVKDETTAQRGAVLLAELKTHCQ